MPLATCRGCGIEGPAKCVAGRRQWKSRGPQQRRRWYCPTCTPPTEPTPAPILEPAAAPRAPSEPPTEPFALLRWERDRAAREDADRLAREPRPSFSIVAAICRLDGEKK